MSAASDAYKALIADLRRGGYVIYLRHAMTATASEPTVGDLADCSWQRNLSDDGRWQAASVGRQPAERAAYLRWRPSKRARSAARARRQSSPSAARPRSISTCSITRRRRPSSAPRPRQAQGASGRAAGAGRQPRVLIGHSPTMQGGGRGRAGRGRGRHREAERRRHLPHRGAAHGGRHHAGSRPLFSAAAIAPYNGGRLHPGAAPCVKRPPLRLSDADPDRRRDPADRCRRLSRGRAGCRPARRQPAALRLRACRLLLPGRPWRAAVADRHRLPPRRRASTPSRSRPSSRSRSTSTISATCRSPRSRRPMPPRRARSPARTRPTSCAANAAPDDPDVLVQPPLPCHEQMAERERPAGLPRQHAGAT